MKLTRMNTVLPVALAVLVWTFATMPVQAKEAEETKDVTAPKAVLDAFHKAYPKAEIHGVSMENEDGQSYYEIESMDGATRRDLLYRADGTVHEIEESIELSDLPAKVKDALKAKFPNGELHGAERITLDGAVQYEVRLESSEDNLEVVLGADGVIKSQEKAMHHDKKTENEEGDEADED